MTANLEYIYNNGPEAIPVKREKDKKEPEKLYAYKSVFSRK